MSRNTSTAGCVASAISAHAQQSTASADAPPLPKLYDAVPIINAAKGLTLRERVTLCALVSRYNYQTGRCFPSLNKIAADTAACQRTVRYVLRRLEEKHVLISTDRERHNKSTTSREYRFNLNALESLPRARGPGRPPKTKPIENKQVFAEKLLPPPPANILPSRNHEVDNHEKDTPNRQAYVSEGDQDGVRAAHASAPEREAVLTRASGPARGREEVSPVGPALPAAQSGEVADAATSLGQRQEPSTEEGAHAGEPTACDASAFATANVGAADGAGSVAGDAGPAGLRLASMAFYRGSAYDRDPTKTPARRVLDRLPSFLTATQRKRLAGITVADVAARIAAEAPQPGPLATNLAALRALDGLIRIAKNDAARHPASMFRAETRHRQHLAAIIGDEIGGVWTALQPDLGRALGITDLGRRIYGIGFRLDLDCASLLDWAIFCAVRLEGEAHFFATDGDDPLALSERLAEWMSGPSVDVPSRLIRAEAIRREATAIETIPY
jgi:hypothetical protein